MFLSKEISDDIKELLYKICDKHALEKEIGIDLGIKDICIISNGDRYENP